MGRIRLPRTKSCFVCGVKNPSGLQLSFDTDGQKVYGEFVPRPEHVGFKGIVHGGVLATVLDEVMVWVCGVVTGRFAFCAEMTTRFVRPVRPGETLQVEAELVTNRRGRLFEARSRIVDLAGVVRVEGRGKYIPVSDEVMREFDGDLLEPWPPRELIKEA